jgi:hypothetical protein
MPALRLRIEFTDRFAEHGARFNDAGSRFHQGQILMVSIVDQMVERRVAEGGPPAFIILAVGLDARNAGLAPLRRNRREWGDEVRAD